MTAEALKVAVALRDSQSSAGGKQTRKQQCGGERRGRGREGVRDGEGKRGKNKVKSKTVENVGLDGGNWH